MLNYGLFSIICLWILNSISASKRQVVFHAEVGTTHQTFQKDNIWIYDKVFTNVGNAYNPSTGKFTVPTNGIYQFHWYTLSDPKKLAHAGLFVNGRMKARQASNNSGSSSQWITAGSSIALPLKKGDEVYIRSVNAAWPTHLRGLWTAFGGVLIN